MNPNIYGRYTKRRGEWISAGEFLVWNTKAVGQHLGLRPGDMHVENSSMFPEYPLMGGTSKEPLLYKGKPFRPERVMVVIFNAALVQPMVERRTREEQSDGPSLCFLWSLIAVAARKFVIECHELREDELLPVNILDQFNYPDERVKEGLLSGWDLEQARREAEEDFYTVYMSQMVIRSALNVDFPAMVARAVAARSPNWWKNLNGELAISR